MYLLQISINELHSDLILSVAQGGFSGAQDNEVRVYNGDTSIINYMQK